MSKIINNISEVIDLYDTFLIDQWGVMHDGNNGYHHAIETIHKLSNANKNLIIVSNSSKRKLSSISRLKSLGFDINYFLEVMTSGEMIWQELKNSIQNYGSNLNNCFHILDHSKKDGLEFREGLNDFSFVSNISKANFILACTPFKNMEPVEYIPTLKIALDHSLIMFCANPDYVSIEKNKVNNTLCMGTIADLYNHMGGEVIILGKPSKEIYLESIKKVKKFDKTRTIAVGDSLDHDILGASNFDIDSILISNGIHKELFQNNIEIGLNNIKNTKKWHCEPTYVCTRFSI